MEGRPLRQAGRQVPRLPHDLRPGQVGGHGQHLSRRPPAPLPRRPRPGQGPGHDRAAHPSRRPRGRARRPGQVHRRPLQPEDGPQVPLRLGRGPHRLDARRGRRRQGHGLPPARRQEGLRRRGVHHRRRRRWPTRTWASP
ncbi:MAG: hypothetical protein MZV64_34085 [Ignavibacteriales bacterium]|nr:hypothetical protein [Ignavibacteriales bacterium]